LHRVEDIIEKVAEGEIDIGVVGLDKLYENRSDDDNILVIYEDLGFWHVNLVFAVPQSWIDVTSLHDLADLAVEMQQCGTPLRIATKFPSLVRRYCYQHGINVFHLVHSAGATEAAPALGYADIIADLSETGNSLRDNQLKVVGHPILHSQACLIGSRRSLRDTPQRLEQVRILLELLEANQHATSHCSIIANLPGTSEEAVGRCVAEDDLLAGLQGPTISPVWNKHAVAGTTTADGWYAVNIIVNRTHLATTVDRLRNIGASTVTVTPVQYTFYAQSTVYQRLLTLLERH
jgi:ATP phosphoribosyltransferase